VERLNQFYRVAFRKKIYRTLEEVQVISWYNNDVTVKDEPRCRHLWMICPCVSNMVYEEVDEIMAV